jgi:uncharacterized protein (DUF4415 family)
MQVELSKEQMEELKKLADMQDEEIDYSDIPSAEDTDWDNAVIGKFYRPVKEKVTIRLDSDIVTWLKEAGRGYQTRANTLLRTAMESERRRQHGGLGKAKKTATR